MLKHLQSHQEYLAIQERLRGLVPLEALKEYQETLDMFQHLNFDSSHDHLASLYSTTGRPALAQIELLRACVFCAYYAMSWERLIHRLHHRSVYRLIIGIDKENIPTLPSFYAISRRLIPSGEKTMVRQPKKRKPVNPFKKNEKMPESKKNRTERVAKLVRKADFNAFRPERHLQKLFKHVSVDSSIRAGILDNALYISGDGTCVHTGASSYGRKTCHCRQKGIFSCLCPRRYSDPLADYGWDSYKEHYFYGHTAYLLSTYNQELACDLPLYLKMVSAKRHDSVTAMISLAEFCQLQLELTFNGFLSDSASDNYETYRLLKEWDIPAFIALNDRKQGHFKYKQLDINNEGIPICEGGLPMVFDGRDYTRHRNKFRCPAKASKCVACPLRAPCSQSDYGRTVYTKTDDNPRFFTEVPRQSAKWRSVMKQRTSIERINKQVLRDCGVENSGVRTRGRITFWLTMAMMVIHLKAQYKHLTTQP